MIPWEERRDEYWRDYHAERRWRAVMEACSWAADAEPGRTYHEKEIPAGDPAARPSALKVLRERGLALEEVGDGDWQVFYVDNEEMSK